MGYFSFDNMNSIWPVPEFTFYEPALVLSCSYTQLFLLECDFVFCFGYFNRYNIDQHDYSVRLKAARKFLSDGDKVKVIVNLKGREKEFRNNAIELIRRFQNDVGKSLCADILFYYYWRQ